MRRRRVLVTGVSRWWGALTVQRLVEDESVEEVIGIDTEEPHSDLGDADFLKVDIRHSLIGKLVRSVGIDTVVHTQTTVDSFQQDARRAHEVNVIGTLNLLAGLAGDDSPVERVVLKSSAHVYGSDYRLPAHIDEETPVDTGSPHSFVRDIVEAESNLFDFGVRNPQVTVVSLRFANALNWEEPAPLARYFDLPLVPTFIGYDPILQLVHRDDAVAALARAAVSGGSGAYNIAGPDPLPLSALLDAVGKMHAPLLPPAGMSAVGAALRAAGLPTLSPQLVDLLRWGRSLDVGAAERTFGFVAHRTTLDALDDYVQQRRVMAFLPSGHSYVYDRELEAYIHNRRARRRTAGGTTLRVAESPPSPEAAGGGRPRRRPQRRPRQS
jgi:UDP-glucose 4-epimerase